MITLSEVVKRYDAQGGAVPVLAGIDLHIGANEFVALTGPSGSGKSTLMNILGCLDTPSGGRYHLNGTDVGSADERHLAAIRNREIGFVFQSFHLLPRMTVRQNVEQPLIYRRVGRRERAREAERLLERVGLGGRMGHLPSQLSGGQRQRVAIARALVTSPSILLADEPTGNLDSRTSDEIMALFGELHGGGQTIVLVTHEPDVAARARRVIRLVDGRITSDVAN